jgi:hypothetical protein
MFTNGRFGWVLRLPMLIGAILIALPGEAVPGVNDWELLGIGLVVMAPTVIGAIFYNRRRAPEVRPA